MSQRRYPWSVLDLDPTEDSRAIRLAYSAKLKAIDVDADPKAFIALREALEAAQAQARWIATHGEVPDWFDEDGDDEYADYPEAEPEDEPEAPISYAPTPSYAPTAAEPSPHAAIDAHVDALVNLLHRLARAGREADEIERLQMSAHFDAILADPRMEQIGFQSDAEGWLADLLAHTSPWSDPLLPRAIAHFGWNRTAGQVTEDYQVGFLVRRQGGKRFRAEVAEDPRHRLYTAWHSLTPDGERRYSQRVRKKRVRELLARIRRDFPELEDEFDPRHVEISDSAARGEDTSPWRLTIFGIVFLLMIVRAIYSGFGDDSSPMPPPIQVVDTPLVDADSEIAVALDRLSDGTLDWKKVQAENANLAEALRTEWRDTKEAGGRTNDFDIRLGSLAAQRIAAMLSKADYALVAQHARFTRDKTIAVIRGDPAQCERMMRGDPVDPKLLSDALRKRERELLVKALLATQGEEPPSGSRHFEIPGEVVDDMVKRSGLSRERITAALLAMGADKDNCRTLIAFIEAALALPEKQGLKLLRQL